MYSLAKRVGVAATVSLGVLALLVPQAQGQFPSPFYQVRPGLTAAQFSYNTALLGQAMQSLPPSVVGRTGYNQFNPYSGAQAGAAASMYSSPYGAASLYSNPYAAASLYGNPYGYGGYGGYGYPSYDPYSSQLFGAAQVTTSQGQLMVNQQQAFLMREQVRSQRLDNRKKAFDEYLYEREKTPTPEEERQLYNRQQLQRSRNDPPLTEVWSGQALNSLLNDLKKQVGRPGSANLRTFPIPLDEDGLKHINVTTGANAGNLGMLKNGGRLSWPVALSGPDFRDERERINSLAQEAVKQAEFNNQVDAGTVRQLAGDVDHMQQQLRRVGSDLSFDQYRDAKTFLNNLSDAIKALQQPNVGSQFTKYQLKARTVPELVKQMADQGLQFAPAVPGDEGAYQALHRALATYDQVAQAENPAPKR